MNWEAIGAIAEAIGVIAILVSLIYVAIQIRQSTVQFTRSIEANELAAFERNIESGNHIRELMILNPDLAELMLKGFRNLDDLDRTENYRFGLLLRNIFSGIQGAFIRQMSVEHDPDKFAGTARIVDELLVFPGVRNWLGKNTPDWRPEFQQFANDRLEIVERQLAESAD
jgi:hypothetical protein